MCMRVHISGVSTQEGGLQDGQMPALRGGAGASAAGGRPTAAVLPGGRHHKPFGLGGGRDWPHLHPCEQSLCWQLKPELLAPIRA